jgi:RimJ/RimL family protein N-acetyltransferase
VEMEKGLIFLEGDKVVLRQHIPEDIPRWYAWFNDQEVTRGMFKGLFPNTPKIQESFLDGMYIGNENLQLAIVSKADKELIGTIGLHKIDFFHRNADISIVIGETEAWGKGLGKEALALIVDHAFNKLCLHKVTGGMYANNESSRRLFERVGFIREAVFREHALCQGKFVDAFKYGLLASEWKKSSG